MQTNSLLRAALKLISRTLCVGAMVFALSTAAQAADAAFDEKPVPVKTPPPKYPAQMRTEGVDGVVAVRVHIAEDGSVAECVVAKSNRSEFDQAAVEAVQKWKFKPAKKDGAPVACKIVIPIRFSLAES